MLPINKKTGLIDFHAFVRQLESKHGFNFHDMADRYRRQQQFCVERGINHTEWYSKQYTKMTPLELEVKELGDAIPYQNVWHWLTDNDFDDIISDGGNLMDLSETRLSEDMSDYVHKVLRILRDELNAEGITDDEVEFYLY